MLIKIVNYIELNFLLHLRHDILGVSFLPDKIMAGDEKTFQSIICWTAKCGDMNHDFVGQPNLSYTLIGETLPILRLDVKMNFDINDLCVV